MSGIDPDRRPNEEARISPFGLTTMKGLDMMAALSRIIVLMFSTLPRSPLGPVSHAVFVMRRDHGGL